MDVVKLQQTFAIILIPLSYIYRIIMGLRRILAASGSQKQIVLSCPCISVGNISWGGTGKTPVVDWLLEWSGYNKLHTVVLTRGYKSKSKVYPLYVRAHHTAREAGDEPLMLALQHPEASILVDPKRIRSGKYAVQNLKPDLIILDDGFQHISLTRSLDLVLFQEDDLTIGWNKVIPSGSWREGAQSLKNASAFLIKANQKSMEALVPFIQKRLFRFSKPVFSFQLQPLYLQKSGSLKQIPLKDFYEKPYILITGIAHPNSVLQTVKDYIGTAPQHHLVYPDHHRYTFHEINYFISFNIPIICTMKDFVKLQSSPIPELWGIQTKAIFEGALWSQWSFPKWLSRWWSREQQAVVKSLGSVAVSTNIGFDASSSLFFGEKNKDSLIDNINSEATVVSSILSPEVIANEIPKAHHDADVLEDVDIVKTQEFIQDKDLNTSSSSIDLENVSEKPNSV